MAGTLLPINPNMPHEQMISALNQNFVEIQNSFLTQIIKDETGTPRLIFGKLPDGDYGLVVSKEGTDVTTVFD